MRAPCTRPMAHSLPALRTAAGGNALRQRRPSSSWPMMHHRRQFVGLPSRLYQHQQQQPRRGSEFPPSEAQRDDIVIAAAAAGVSSSRWPAGAGTSSSSIGRDKENRTRASASSSSASTATASMPSSSSASSTTSRGRELLDAIADLPWQRVAVWAVVAWAAYQLKDFFGVREQGGRGEGEKGSDRSESKRLAAASVFFFPWTSSLSLSFAHSLTFSPKLQTHSPTNHRSSWEPLSSRSSVTGSSARRSRRASFRDSSKGPSSGAASWSPGTSPSSWLLALFLE